MTMVEKLDALKTLLGVDDTRDDALLIAYLKSAQCELLAWKYGYLPEASRPSEVPACDEQTQIWAVIAGYSQRGAENQSSHSENGISRSFAHSDMVQYIRANTVPVVGVV